MNTDLASDLSLGQALTAAEALTDNIVSSLDLALNRAYSKPGASDFARDLARARIHANEFASWLALRRIYALNGAPALTDPLAAASDRANELADTLSRAFADAGMRDDDLARALARPRACAGALVMALDLGSAPASASTPPPQDVPAATPQEQRPAGHVTPSAGRLLTAASRLLPPAERARYSEEYHSELWDIAVAGGRRPQQLRYAVRQVIRAAPLRAAMHAPHRRSASP